MDFAGKLNKNALCNKCKIKLKQEEKFEIEKIDNDILKEKAHFFAYDGFIRDGIILYKFRNRPYLYESFVNFIINNKNFLDFLKSYDIIIPVPISKMRLKTRGYNQSTLLANKIASLYNKMQKKNAIKVVSDVLLKEEDTIEQSSLNKTNRESNAIGAYRLQNKKKLKNKNILILDDIYTTGNTILECSQMIKQANPKSIGAFTIAKDL